MVSTDHFRQELVVRLTRATRIGLLEISVNSAELCRSIKNGSASSAFCHDAMEAE
jgi:hypothetical protein